LRPFSFLFLSFLDRFALFTPRPRAPFCVLFFQFHSCKRYLDLFFLLCAEVGQFLLEQFFPSCFSLSPSSSYLPLCSRSLLFFVSFSTLAERWSAFRSFAQQIPVSFGWLLFGSFFFFLRGRFLTSVFIWFLVRREKSGPKRHGKPPL